MSTESEDISSTEDNPPEAEQTPAGTEDIPTMQWLYNRIFLLAVASLVFFFLVYAGWGLIDILSVPAR